MIVDERPFYSDPWKGAYLEAAQAIWDWRIGLRNIVEGDRTGSFDFMIEARRFREQQYTSLVDDDVISRVNRAVQRFGLDAELFAMQIESAARLVGPIRFRRMVDQREFFAAWVYPHGRLLATLAKVGGPLYVNQVDAMSGAFFLVRHLVNLPADAARGHLFIPNDDLEAFGVSEEALMTGPPEDATRKLLWKQCVRIRDYFARALPLSRDLPRRHRTSFRRWWLGGLEVLNAIERRKFDVWAEPVGLSPYYRAQARFQARFARVSFGHK